MNVSTIPFLNNDFDPRLLLLIARRSIVIIICFFLLALGGSFLYLRYTPNIYQSQTIVKLGQKDNGNKILNIGRDFLEQDNASLIAGSIELIRSDVILQRAITRLPFRISYFNKGAVLSNELYKRSPFSVDVALRDSSLIGLPVFVKFENELVQLFDEKKNPISAKVLPGKWISTSHGLIRVSITDEESIRENMAHIRQENFYFVINNTASMANLIAPKLTVSLLNEQAMTIMIQVKDNDANKAADIANAIAEEFNKYDLEKKGEGAEQTLAYINDQLKIVGDQLRNSELLLQDFKANNKTLNPEGEVKLATSRFGELQEERVKIQLQENVLDKLSKNIAENKEPENFFFLMGENNNPLISSLISSIQKLEDEKEQVLLQATAQSSTVKFLNSKIESRRKQLVQAIALSKKNLEDRNEEINKVLSKYNQDIRNMPSKESEYNRIERLFTIHESFYSSLLQKKAEFQIVKAGLVSENTVLQRARVSDSPLGPNRSLAYLYGLVVAAFVSLLLIAIRYLLHNVVLSVDDIKPYTSAPIVGVIPKYKEDIPVSELIVDKSPKSLITEAFRTVRTNLQFISNTPGVKIIGITSTISGEGKTFVSINLAGIMAFSGKRVIILDLDMRKPKIHIGFNVENTKGISTILIGKDTVDECVYRSGLENLDFITAGPVPPNPSELIIGQRMTELIDYLKTKYDVIMIDTPPVGIVTDGIPIMQKVDYPLYIMRSGFSKKFLIGNINRLVHENHIRNLSVILNSQESARGGYGYGGYGGFGGYGYGYGYGYYEEEKKENKSILRKILNI